MGDRRQEIAFIGVRRRWVGGGGGGGGGGGERWDVKARLVAALDGCLLTEEEWAGGWERWREMEDPFPAW